MKLYGVFLSPHKGTATLETCEVEEETNEFYLLKRGSFTYDGGIIVSKNHPMLALDPAAAVAKFVARNSKKIVDYEGRIKVLDKSIKDAQELLEGEK